MCLQLTSKVYIISAAVPSNPHALRRDIRARALVRDLLLGTTIIDGQVQDYELELKRMINIVEPLVRILFNNVRYTKKRTINERESPNDEARSNRHRSKHRILVLVGDVNNRQGYSASNVVGGYCCGKNDLLDDLLILYSVLVLTGVLFIHCFHIFVHND